ncbi:MAG: DNA starvation/stationary phase protection protein [Burkholderiaceae bacterium]|nr:DNA starvation/stationary phase protection protein [Burkholderiaceae bacterium]
MTLDAIYDAPLTQEFGTVKPVFLDLSTDVRQRSVTALNRLLAHAMAMRDLYKKAHWQISGPSFYALHLLFDKHYQEQLALIDQLAERVQTLGGVALALAQDVVDESRIAHAPRGREAPEQQLQRLVGCHALVLREARALARRADEAGDDGTADLIIGSLVRTYELQSWFVGEHLTTFDVPALQRNAPIAGEAPARENGQPAAH